MAVELLSGQKQNGESSRAIQACNDYLLLGPGRSLNKLHQKYAETTLQNPPSKNLRWIKEWSRTFDWTKRAATYDAEHDRQKNELAQEHRREAMESGLALDYERVTRLKRLAEFLEGQLYEQGKDGVFHNVWIPDVRLSKYEKVEIERFNSALIEQIRSTWDDIAKETGGRKSNASTTNLNINLSQLTDAQLQRIANGEDPLAVIATTESGG